MSFIEQLKLKQTDLLPLVRPRIASRFESYPITENEEAPDPAVNYSTIPSKTIIKSKSFEK